MKKTIYTISLLAAALLATACQGELQNIEEYQGDGTLCFAPALSGSGVTVGTRASELVSTDGSISIPLNCSVSEGIGGSAVAQTRGEQLNTTVAWDNLGTYIDTFYVAAWKGGSEFVPEDTEVTKGAPLWKTSIEYRWEATEEATFYAYANLPASGAEITATSSEQTLEYTVPTAASGQKDILMGCYTGCPQYNDTLHKGGIAEVRFYHPLTAVRFKMGTFAGTTSFQIKSISIKGVYASGSAEMNPTTIAATDCGDFFSWTQGSTTQTVTMTPASGTYFTADADGFIGDAFLLIPQTITTTKPVKISITAIVDGSSEEKKFEARLTDNSWAAGKTNVYTLGNDTADYNFSLSSTTEITSMTKSYASSISDRTPETILITSQRVTENWDWEIRSYQIGSASPVNLTESETGFTAGGLVVSELSLSGVNICLSLKAQKWEPYLPGSHDYWTNSSGRTDKLDWSPASWEGKGTIDLSKFNFQTETTNNAMNTANCYVIRHAGTYKFPLVYGNGIVNGAFNEKSYYPNPSTSDANTLQRFVNHKGYGIKSPFIEYNTSDGQAKSSSNTYLAPTGAHLVWSENSNVVMISDDCISQETVTVKDENGVSHNYTVSYLTFTVPQATICNNSAVIAVTDANGVMWSWHIWTTNDPALLKPAIPVTNHAGNEYGFFPISCIGYKYGSKYRERDDVVITLVQKTSGKTLKITVEQPKTLTGEQDAGSYFQWGRKDPMPNNAPTGFSIENAQISLQTAILYPGKFYKNSDQIAGTKDWCNYNDGSKFYCNLWTGKHNTPDPAEENSNMTKTIYDPSPVGYKVPSINVFTGFTTTGANSTSLSECNVKDSYDLGWNFYTDATRTSSIFFSEIKYRNFAGTLYSNAAIGRYWSSTPNSFPKINGAYEFQFRSTYVNPLSENAAKPQALPIRPIVEQ